MFERLVRPHFDRLYRLAWHLTRRKVEAEDLFQELLIKAYGKLDVLAKIDEPGSWLCRVMYNLFVDERRRFARRRMHTVEEGALPLVVLLHDTEGYKLTEIQALTGIPVGTVKSRLHRARARLREILTQSGTIS
jgi:RNA polymerase sigma-70 factor (ECF subfamily)